jgi:RNA polymerase sigma-70 factor (ECF subfamily)
VTEPIWLEPLPDELVDEHPTTNPEARYEARESVTLAFLTALQTLPGRQRAVLILRDVLGWSASEAAEALDMTESAVNSALQRARATLQQPEGRDPRRISRADDEQTAYLLARYVAAWESSDAPALVALLREDVVLTMPPLPAWFQGRAAVQGFLEGFLFANFTAGRFRLAATHANGGPAFAVYQSDDSGVYRPSALHVLTIENGQIAVIHDFLTFDDKLFSRFGLPLSG